MTGDQGGFLMEGLSTLTGQAAVDVFVAVFGNGGPPEVTLNELDSFSATGMACCD